MKLKIILLLNVIFIYQLGFSQNNEYVSKIEHKMFEKDTLKTVEIEKSIFFNTFESLSFNVNSITEISLKTDKFQIKEIENNNQNYAINCRYDILFTEKSDLVNYYSHLIKLIHDKPGVSMNIGFKPGAIIYCDLKKKTLTIFVISFCGLGVEDFLPIFTNNNNGILFDCALKHIWINDKKQW